MVLLLVAVDLLAHPSSYVAVLARALGAEFVIMDILGRRGHLMANVDFWPIWQFQERIPLFVGKRKDVRSEVRRASQKVTHTHIHKHTHKHTHTHTQHTHTLYYYLSRGVVEAVETRLAALLALAAARILTRLGIGTCTA